jgi:RHS repeat-associated protein
VSYDYDEANRIANIKIGDTRFVGYRYDFRGRLRRIDTPAGNIEYEYPPGNERVQRKLPNGVQTVWRYLPSGALASLEHAGPDGKLLVRFEYAHRPDGLLREVLETTIEGNRTLSYDYDSLGRLTTATDSRRGKFTYRYDAFANCTEVVGPDGKSATSAYDWAGRLTEHDGQPCSHDGAGNLSRYSRGDKEVTLEHNPMGQPVSAQTPAGEVRYVYDGEGRLVTRTSRGRKTDYLPDPQADTWKPLLETSEDGQQLSYVWERDKPLAALAGAESQFFLENQQGSVRCVVDTMGKVVEWRDYDPFGASPTATAGRIRPGFAGLFYDTDVGLYLTRYRVYDPALGRFLQPDPKHRVPSGSQKDLSLYAYCGADPINYTDRDGADSLALPTQGLSDLRTWFGTPYKWGVIRATALTAATS